MKAAIYGRNSKPPRGWKPKVPGELPPGSWELQVKECRRAAEASGDDVAFVESDKANSGRDANRPAWQRLVAEVRGHHVQRVYVSKLDRVMRNLQHFLHVADVFEDAGCELVFVNQPGASIRKADSAGKAFRSMLGVFAEFELDLIRERSLAVLSVGEDGRIYGPRSAKPAGRPNEYGDGHRMRQRNGRMVHDKARCRACRGEKGGSEAPLSAAPENGGLAEPVGFATPGQPVSAGEVAGVQPSEPVEPVGNVVVAKGGVPDAGR